LGAEGKEKGWKDRREEGVMAIARETRKKDCTESDTSRNNAGKNIQDNEF
jgi:hypothetical protein